MATGFFTAASGMLMQQRSLNVLGNNMSNISTPGYKTERVVSNIFEFELLNRIENGDNLIGVGAPVRIVQDVPVDFDSPSSLQHTERPFDMAINGIGFFNVKVPGQGDAEEEVMMTRNGNFDIDEEGYLVLRGIGRVQGKKGDIKVGGSDFTIRDKGEVYDKDGRLLDSLYITSANENTQLTKARNGLYRVETAPPDTPETIAGTVTYDRDDAAGVTEVTNPDVRQGWLEASNVDLNREISLMIEVQRNFDSCRQILRVVDGIDQKTAEICKI